MASGTRLFCSVGHLKNHHVSYIKLREFASAQANFARILKVVIEGVFAAKSALARGTLDVALVFLQVAPQVLHASERLVAQVARGFAVVRANMRRAIALVSVAPFA